MGEEVGDIDQHGNRAQADCLQPLLQPFGRRAVLDATDQTTGKGRAACLCLRSDGDADRVVELAGNRLAGQWLQGADALGCQITGNAVDAGTVATVRGQADLEHRIIQTGIFHIRGTDRCILWQVDDAVMLVRQLQLTLGAHHAVALDTANFGGFQGQVDAGHMGAARREHALETGAGIGCATDHLNDFIAGIDAADLQLVGIGVLAGILDLGDTETTQLVRRVINAVDLKTERGQGHRQFLDRGRGVEIFTEPGKGEFHRVSILYPLRPKATLGRASGTKP